MGAVLGVLGGPLGGVFALGAGILLQYLFPQKVEGPRQEDTKVSTAKYGDPIGTVIGSGRIAGNYFWLEGDQIVEHKKTQRQGKGGPVVTEYTYTSTSAVVFDYDGPVAGFIRIWMDKELVYDNSPEAAAAHAAGIGTGFGAAGGVTFTFYLGTDDQQPDARIVADKGADNTSAYRGQAYLIMEDLDHTDIGIRLPNIEVEFAKGIDPEDPEINQDWTSFKFVTEGRPDGFSWATTVFGGKIAFFPQSGTGGREDVYFFDTLTAELEATVPQTFPAYGIDGGIALISESLGVIQSRTGEAYFFNTSVGGSDFDPTFWNNHGSSAINNTPWSIYKAAVNKLAVFIGSRIEVLDPVEKTLLTTQFTTFGSLVSTRGFACNAAVNKFYVISNYTLDIVPGGGSATNYNLDSLYGTGFLGQVWAIESGGCVIRAENGFYKIADDGSLVASRLEHGSLNTMQLSNNVGPYFDETPGEIPRWCVWYANYASSVMTYYKMAVDEDIPGDELMVVYEVVPAPVEEPGTLPRIAYLPDLNCFIRVSGSTAKTYVDIPAEVVVPPEYPVLERVPLSLATVLERVAIMEGMTIDTSEITKEIWGYTVKGDVTARGILEDLCRIFAVDHCQVDGTYKFFNRDNVSALTIDADHIGASLKSDGFPVDQVEEFLADEMDLPKAVTLTYLSFNASYRTGSQRVDIPLDSSESLNEQAITSNASLSDDEAAQAADVLLREARESQDTYAFDLPWYYARLHPGVVITVPLEGGATMKVVIDEIEDDGVLKLKTHKRTIDYLSDAIGVDTHDIVITRITDAVPDFWPMDSNMLRDDEADDNDGFYMVTSWLGTIAPRGINVWRSLNGGDTYDGWASFVNFATVCELLSPLAEELSPYIPHPTASFTFQNISKGVIPSSVSYEEWLDETLGCLIRTSTGEWEIVLVNTITEIGTNVYEASGLVRGFRGTENLTADHAIGDTIIWLDASKTARTIEGNVGLELFFVTSILGVAFDDTDAEAFTNTAKSLKPWRPVLITGERDSGATETLTVSFERQTRYGGNWLDGTEDVPLHETTEEYEIDYYEGVTLLRTRTGLTAPTDDYTLAEYTTDAGGSPTEIPTLIVDVYQVSQEYTINNGRGYVGRATV